MDRLKRCSSGDGGAVGDEDADEEEREAREWARRLTAEDDEDEPEAGGVLEDTEERGPLAGSAATLTTSPLGGGSGASSAASSLTDFHHAVCDVGGEAGLDDEADDGGGNDDAMGGRVREWVDRLARSLDESSSESTDPFGGDGPQHNGGGEGDTSGEDWCGDGGVIRGEGGETAPEDEDEDYDSFYLDRIGGGGVTVASAEDVRAEVVAEVMRIAEERSVCSASAGGSSPKGSCANSRRGRTGSSSRSRTLSTPEKEVEISGQLRRLSALSLQVVGRAPDGSADASPFGGDSPDAGRITGAASAGSGPRSQQSLPAPFEEYGASEDETTRVATHHQPREDASGGGSTAAMSSVELAMSANT